MANLRYATLCHAAMPSSDGLISILNSGIVTWKVEQLPAIVAVTLVAVVEWDANKDAELHVIGIEVVADEEVVSTVRIPSPHPQMQFAELPPTTNLVYQIAFDARRLGTHHVVVTTDGDELDRLPLIVFSDLPLQ